MPSPQSGGELKKGFSEVKRRDSDRYSKTTKCGNFQKVSETVAAVRSQINGCDDDLGREAVPLFRVPWMVDRRLTLGWAN